MNLRTHLLAVSALFAAAALSAQDTTTETKAQQLRYAFAKGATGHMLVQSSQTGAMDMGGQKMNIDQKLAVTLGWTVTEVTDGKAHIELVIETIKLSMDAPMMGKMEWDSTDEDSDPPAMLGDIAGAIGNRAHYSIDARGHVTDFEGPEVEVPGLALEESTQQWLPILPEEAVPAGHKWTHEHDIGADQMGTIKATTTHTIQSVEGKKVQLATSSQLELEGAEGGQQVEAEFEESVGETTLMLDKPVPESYSSKTKAKMTMGQGITMNMTIANSARKCDAPKKAGDADKDDAADKGKK